MGSKVASSCNSLIVFLMFDFLLHDSETEES